MPFLSSSNKVFRIFNLRLKYSFYLLSEFLNFFNTVHLASLIPDWFKSLVSLKTSITFHPLFPFLFTWFPSKEWHSFFPHFQIEDKTGVFDCTFNTTKNVFLHFLIDWFCRSANEPGKHQAENCEDLDDITRTMRKHIHKVIILI